VLLSVTQEVLPSFLSPTSYFFVDRLPVSGTGKLDRRALRKLLVDLQSESSQCAEIPETHDYSGWLGPVTLAWKAVLSLPRNPTPASSFAEWGGDSFACTRVCVQLWEAYKAARGLLDSEEADEERDGGHWGERLPGAFAPGELLKRPKLRDWAAHFRERMGKISSDEDSSETATAIAEVKAIHDHFRRACSAPIPSLASFLLGRGVSPDLDLPPGSPTPLQSALFLGHLQIARVLLEAGADPLRKGGDGMQTIHFSVHGSLHASTEDTKLLFEQLLAKGARLDAKDGTGASIFHHAARVGVSRSVLDFLLSLHRRQQDSRKGKRGKDSGPHPLSWRDQFGRTPLHWATINGHRTVVQHLATSYQAESLIEAVDNDGETAVMMAMRRARCGAEERGGRGGATVWGDIAGLLGGGGSTKEVRVFVPK
jgi:ankyrin repeat protein